MYKRILAAINEHLNSEAAARYALLLARSCGARLHICFIAPKDHGRRDFERAEEAVKRLFLEAEEAGIAVESIVENGDPVHEISRIVRREEIDLAFAATRREDIERRFYAGSVSRELSLRLPCSVALVRVVHLGKDRPKKILVPLKARIGRLRERAHFTAGMAACCDAKIHLFHVPQRVAHFFHGEVHLTPAEWSGRIPRDIQEFRRLLEHQGIDHTSIMAPGGAGRAITIEASAQRHDLIIMGTSERSLLSSLLRGNPVERVLNETPCNLIILNPKQRP